mgnify:CR=1 FL=1
MSASALLLPRRQSRPRLALVEVTAGGRIVRNLETREDVQGAPVRLTIDGPLQDYAARRIGLESGSVVVMDCRTGDLLCMASMPSFDPNSFSDGIGGVEYAMLRDDERVPLRNKVLKGLYPPGSTVKPMVSMALMQAGIDPEETVNCGGGLRVGNRVFGCWNRRGHGATNMAKAIYQSCDVYFYAMAQRTGMQPIADMARRLPGIGIELCATDAIGAPASSRLRQLRLAKVAASSCGCASGCGVHGHDHARSWGAGLPVGDLKSFWGALGCACWAV